MRRPWPWRWSDCKQSRNWARALAAQGAPPCCANTRWILTRSGSSALRGLIATMSQPESFKRKLPGLWRVLRHFWPETRKHRWLIAGSWTALLLEVGFRLLEPWPLKVVFDRVINKVRGAHGYRVSLFDIFDPFDLLVGMAVLTVVLTALRAVAGYYTTVA